jgi:hypothetical protein
MTSIPTIIPTALWCVLIGVLLTSVATLVISIVMLVKVTRRTAASQPIVLERIEGLRGQLVDIYADQEQSHRFMRNSLDGLLSQFKNWCK